MFLEKEKKTIKLVSVLATSTPITVAKKKVAKDVENDSYDENSEKDKYLKTNFIQVLYM